MASWDVKKDKNGETDGKYTDWELTENSWDNLEDTWNKSSSISAWNPYSNYDKNSFLNSNPQWNASAGSIIHDIGSNSIFEGGVEGHDAWVSDIEDSAKDITIYTAEAVASFGNLANGDRVAQELTEASDAVASASLDYINEKIKKIKEVWTSTEEVTVQSLLDTVSPQSIDFKSLFKKNGLLLKVVNSLVSQLTGLSGNTKDGWGSYFGDLGTDAMVEILDSISSNPAVSESLSNLSLVKGVVGTMESVTSIVEIVEKFLDFTEKLRPILDIAWAFGTMFGVGASSGASEVSKVAENKYAVAVSVLLKPVRKYIFGVRVRVPSLLLGVANTIRSDSAYAGYTWDATSSANSWWNAIAQEDYYKNTSLYNNKDGWNNKLNTWASSSKSELSKYDSSEKLMGLATNWSSDGDSKGWAKIGKTVYNNSIKGAYVQQAISNSRQKANIIKSSQLSWNEMWNTSYSYYGSLSSSGLHNTEGLLGNDFDDNLQKYKSDVNNYNNYNDYAKSKENPESKKDIEARINANYLHKVSELVNNAM